MLITRRVKEKQVKYLTIVQREVDYEDDLKVNGRTVYKQMLINAKLQIGNGGKKREVTGRNP
jgi:hypothetical protein